jgi:hypothetical protein
MKSRPAVPRRRRRDPDQAPVRPGNPRTQRPTVAHGASAPRDHGALPPPGLGPYEAAYDIAMGYGVERSIILP